MALISVFMFIRIKQKYGDGLISKSEGIVGWLLINYIMVLLFFTLIGRHSWDYYRYNFDPGYSYRQVFLVGDMDLAAQLLSNIAVFIPIGIMASFLSRRFSFVKTILCGFLISLIIEFLQLVLKLGCCEIDDLISNLIGTLLGCIAMGIFRLVCLLRKHI